jgi:phosphohistidine phosphatase SixA
MLVGHMPHLPRLLRLLVAGTPKAETPDFPPHGIVELVETGEKNSHEKSERSGVRSAGKWVEIWRATSN